MIIKKIINGLLLATFALTAVAGVSLSENVAYADPKLDPPGDD